MSCKQRPLIYCRSYARDQRTVEGSGTMQAGRRVPMKSEAIRKRESNHPAQRRGGVIANKVGSASRTAAARRTGGGYPFRASCSYCSAAPSITAPVRSNSGSQPVPARRRSAASAIASFFIPAMLAAASTDTPSRTASMIRSLETRPK